VHVAIEETRGDETSANIMLSDTYLSRFPYSTVIYPPDVLDAIITDQQAILASAQIIPARCEDTGIAEQVLRGHC